MSLCNYKYFILGILKEVEGRSFPQIGVATTNELTFKFIFLHFKLLYSGVELIFHSVLQHFTFVCRFVQGMVVLRDSVQIGLDLKKKTISKSLHK